jgi:hypothetical protein
LILGGHVGDQVDNTLGVSPFVIVPRNEFDKVVVERDTGLGVEDGGVWVTNEVSGDDSILGIVKNSLMKGKAVNISITM